MSVIFNLLKQIFKEYDVVREWDVARDSQDGFTRELYCPRVDFAVGPFNLDANIDYNNRLIEEAYQKYKSLLELLKSRSDSKDKVLKPNENPRCFLVIEIEHKSSRKHRLGSIVNASALGKIGIIVASDQKVFESLVKIRKYLEFLDHVQKTRCAPENIMIITKENFLEILRRYSEGL
ncbi:MAG: hypothetical protein C0177_07295 [Fervidicoccus fontis]|nr:MAG: hypothetical protein C0177_07295 [Fervidicoccus fontis]